MIELYKLVSSSLKENSEAFIISLLLSAILWLKVGWTKEKDISEKIIQDNTNDSKKIIDLKEELILKLQDQKDATQKEKEELYIHLYGESRETAIYVMEALKDTKKLLEIYISNQNDINKEIKSGMESLKTHITEMLRDMEGRLRK